MPSKSHKRTFNPPPPIPEVQSKKSGRIAAKQQDKDQVSIKRVEKANAAQIEGAGLQEVNVDLIINGDDQLVNKEKAAPESDVFKRFKEG